MGHKETVEAAVKSSLFWTAGVLSSVILGINGAAAAPEHSVIHDELQQFTAQVESVDTKQRTIVLKTPASGRAEFSVGPQVRNLEQVKPGDRVILRYYMGLAAEIKPSGTTAQGTQDKLVAENAPAGVHPSGTIGHSVSATVIIDAVDTSFNTVTFKRADGITRTVAVDSPKGQDFIRKLKKGDAVEITYTESVAVSVEPGVT
jgi:hypothetical protein